MDHVLEGCLMIGYAVLGLILLSSLGCFTIAGWSFWRAWTWKDRALRRRLGLLMLDPNRGGRTRIDRTTFALNEGLHYSPRYGYRIPQRPGVWRRVWTNVCLPAIEIVKWTGRRLVLLAEVARLAWRSFFYGDPGLWDWVWEWLGWGGFEDRAAFVAESGDLSDLRVAAGAMGCRKAV